MLSVLLEALPSGDLPAGEGPRTQIRRVRVGDGHVLLARMDDGTVIDETFEAGDVPCHLRARPPERPAPRLSPAATPTRAAPRPIPRKDSTRVGPVYRQARLGTLVEPALAERRMGKGVRMETGRERDDDAEPAPAVVEDAGEGETLEDAVKGIATGIVGKLKEVAGELLEDDALEQRGVRQQRASDEMRSGGHRPDEGDAPV